MKIQFEEMMKKAMDCQLLIKEIDDVRPISFETDASVDTVVGLIEVIIDRYEGRFADLFEAYSKAVEAAQLFNINIEECILQWWGACDDLHCAVEGLTFTILDTDNFDNALLGIRALSLVRGARFFKLLEQSS